MQGDKAQAERWVNENLGISRNGELHLYVVLALINVLNGIENQLCLHEACAAGIKSAQSWRALAEKLESVNESVHGFVAATGFHYYVFRRIQIGEAGPVWCLLDSMGVYRCNDVGIIHSSLGHHPEDTDTRYTAGGGSSAAIDSSSSGSSSSGSSSSGSSSSGSSNIHQPDFIPADEDLDSVDGDAERQPNELLGRHWLIATQWQEHGFPPFKNNFSSKERVGARIVKLLEKDQSLERAIPPHSDWAKGWVPMHNKTLLLKLSMSSQVVVNVQPAGARFGISFNGDLQLDTNHQVLAVTEGGAADTAGMNVGDVIHRVSGVLASATEGELFSSDSSSGSGFMELEVWRKGSIQSTDISMQTEGNGGSGNTIGGRLIRACYAKICAMRKADEINLTKGRVLDEKDQPKSPFAFFPCVIRAYNASGGKCGCESPQCRHNGRCGALLCTGLTHVTTRRQAQKVSEESGVEASHDYSNLQFAWSIDRIVNWLFHLECNVRDKVICLRCQKHTSGLEQLTNPRFSSTADELHSINASTYRERYKQCQAQAALMRSELGGPAAALTVRWDQNKPVVGHKERDQTTVFTCLKCSTQMFRRNLMWIHCRRCNGFTPRQLLDHPKDNSLFECSPEQFWEERPRTSDDGVKCTACGLVLPSDRSLMTHLARWCPRGRPSDRRPKARVREAEEDSEEEAEESSEEEAEDGMEEDDNVVCMTCNQANSEEGNELLLCDGRSCEAAYHLRRVTVPTIY